MSRYVLNNAEALKAFKATNSDMNQNTNFKKGIFQVQASGGVVTESMIDFFYNSLSKIYTGGKLDNAVQECIKSYQDEHGVK